MGKSILKYFNRSSKCTALFLRLLLFALLLLTNGKFSFGQQKVTLSSLLSEMIDANSEARWPTLDYTIKQASSYDRRSVSPGKPGWTANNDFSNYVRTEQNSGRREMVMLDVDGPGVIVRFWITTLQRKGIMRIYLDNRELPMLEIPGYDLMIAGLKLGPALLNPHSSYGKTEKGGSTLYLPLPYAKHCKITFEDFDTANKQPRYYQINYRTYEKSVRVETFSLSQLIDNKTLIDQVEEKLYAPPVQPDERELSIAKVLSPREETSLELPKGSAAVQQLEIKLTTENKADYAQALRSTVLKITFDDRQTVWCPIGDFSGSGVGGKKIQSWYRTVDDDGKIISRWTMPFKKSAIISVHNFGQVGVKVVVRAMVGKWKWDRSSMYFHTSWKQNIQVPIVKYDELNGKDWNMNTMKGKGVYLGHTLSVFNHMHLWYGEGDQKVWVDKDSFPSEFGTGTEDYYNTSWAPVVLYQTPFANAPRADNSDSYGYNTFTRTRNLDRIPFKSLFKLDLEMLGWSEGTADFAVTTYWYGFEGVKDMNESMEEEVSKKLPE